MGFAWLVFDVRIQGSLGALAGVCAAGALTFGAMALLVASRAQTIEALSGLLNFVMLPMWILSGVFFAASNFPDPMQPIIQVLPLTALIDALRAIMLRGAGLDALMREAVTLALWLVVCFFAALKLFRWR
jgi:ABC-type multidrug transport system permease subunit